MDLTTTGDSRERLADLCLTGTLLGERLRSRDTGQGAIAILAGNGRRILRVRKPMDMGESPGCLIASLRHEGDVADLLQTRVLTVLSLDRVDLMERDEHVGATQR